MATQSANQDEKPSIFEPISGENEDTGLTEVQSLCVNCEEEGTTKFLFIKIPFYKEIIISSFYCPHCSASNNEIQSAGTIQEKGVIITCKVQNKSDLNRQVVRADIASVSIPELGFEIPPASQKGTLSTIEGIIQRSVDGLLQEQPIRKSLHPDVFEKIKAFIAKLEILRTGETPFTLVVNDPSGNSFVENPHAPNNDPELTFTHYKRNLEQNKALGLSADDAVQKENKSEEIELPEPGQGLDLKNEVVTFSTECPSCGVTNETNMKVVQIPHFKEVIIMATNCDSCGKRTNEVKSGTGFEPKGKIITLKVKNEEDMSRDVLKSETCTIKIPELDFITGGNAISGKFTTVEGLLVDLKAMMLETNPFVGGDSATNDKLRKFVEKLDSLLKGATPFTLILDDMNSNSFIQNIYTPEPDPGLSEEEYERTYEQNEELGLNDMNTENYTS
ncbi:zinc finger protein ZPR1 [Ciona intestinalis]